MDKKIRQLGRSTIYKLCRYVNRVQVPLERCYVAIREWTEKELEEYGGWRSSYRESQSLGRKLNDPYTRLSDLIEDQLKLLVSLKHEFVIVTDTKEADTELMDLFEHLLITQLTVQEIHKEHQLDQDEATKEAGKDASMKVNGF